MERYIDKDFPWQWKQISYRLEDRNLRLIEITNAEELFDKLISKGPNNPEVKDERIPYWTEIWPSALGMSSYLLQNAVQFSQKAVVEIGCGMGLPGMISQMLGANVLLTDYLADAQLAANLLWELNDQSPPNWQTMDWRNPDQSVKGDIILASDVIYEERNYIPLMEALPKLLNEGGYTLLSEPRRSYSKDFFNRIPPEFICIRVHSKFLSWKNKTYEIDVYRIEARGEKPEERK